MNSLQLQIAARTVWGEARGTGEAGIDAVAHVLWNRVKDDRWGATLFQVCLAPYQFSCWNVGDPNRNLMLELDDADPILAQCVEAVSYAQIEPDPTAGAMWYFSNDITAPAWAKGAIMTAKIGPFFFYKGVK
jgi:N-acetylmuramoyl-L-alanine amidase